MGVSNFENNIRAMAMIMRDNGEISQIVKKVNTGSYIYTTTATFNPSQGLKYHVNKRFVNGKDLGTINVDRVTRHCVDYHSYSIRIPDSVCKAIRNHYIALANAIGVLDF